MTLPRSIGGWLVCAASVAIMGVCLFTGWQYVLWILGTDSPPRWLIGSFRTYATIAGVAVIAWLWFQFHVSVGSSDE